jgi:hypothetical protein
MTGLHKGGVGQFAIAEADRSDGGQQLIAKGLRQVGLEDHSDLPVRFWVGLKDKQCVESQNSASRHAPQNV